MNYPPDTGLRPSLLSSNFLTAGGEPRALLLIKPRTSADKTTHPSRTMPPEPVKITIEALVNAPVSRVWDCWVTPEEIMKWNAASDDWHTASAVNDLRVGGAFNYRMEAKDGSMGFDFAGEYTEIQPHSVIAYRFAEAAADREVRVEFLPDGEMTTVRETFVAEGTHPVEVQRSGWQSILDRFKAHVECPS